MLTASRFALLALCLSVAVPSFGQTRDEKIGEIVRILGAVEFPAYRGEVLPRLARSEAQRTLTAIGKQWELGSEWRRGNPYWDRTETALIRDFEAALDRHSARRPENQMTLALALLELSDADLDQVAGFYRSELFTKSVRRVDRMATAFGRLMVMLHEQSAPPAGSDPKELEKELAQLELTRAEEQRLAEFVESPAYRLLKRGPASEFISAGIDSGSLLKLQRTDAVRRVVADNVSAFRTAHRIAPPLPPTYAADLAFEPRREKRMRELANSAMRGDAEALSQVRMAAEGGDVIAQAEFGRMHLVGRGVERDEKAAFEWTKRAAERQFPRAHFNLGVHFEQGIGVDASLEQAVALYRRAADRGFARARLSLGLMHREGRGVPQDFQESLRLIEAAAKQYLPGAELAMAEIYDAGAGIGADVEAADEWLTRAVNQGYAPASQYRAQREKMKTQLVAMVKSSPASARGAATSVDRAELSRRLLDAVRRANINITNVRELLEAGAEIEARDTRPNEGETPLHHVARRGDIEVARLLVSRGAKVNIGAPSGFTPLHVAAGLNRGAMAEYLLGAGANPDAEDSRGTPLHAATVQAHAGIVSLLLSKGADPNARDPNGRTPLHMMDLVASYRPAHTEIIVRLAEAGGDLFARTGKDRAGATAIEGIVRQSEDAAIAILESGAPLTPVDAQATPVTVALAGAGHLTALKLAEQKRLPLDARGGDGQTPLHRAARAGKLEAATYLIGKGVPVDAVDAKGRTPLHWAADHGYSEIVRLLLGGGANIDRRDARGWTPLMAAAYAWRDGQAARVLVERKADLAARDNEGRSVLEISLLSQTEEAAGALLDFGAPLNSKDAEGRTALHKAVTAKQVDLLIRRGIDVNATDARGMSPLFYAVKRQYASEQLTKALLSHGAATDMVALDRSRLIHHAAAGPSKTLESLLDAGSAGGVSDVTEDGRIPLHWAAESGYPASIEMLVKRGSQLNAQTTAGDTPLHLAAGAKGKAANVRALLNAGANPGLRNNRGASAPDIAGQTENTPVIKLFSSIEQ